jgi:choline kinase
MRGIVLAAGSGTRFNGGGLLPKCLAPFEDRTLLDLQLAALRACGIDDVTVVVGFEASRVRRACGARVRFIENTRYSETNSLYSLWMARTLLDQPFVVMNCDVLFSPALLSDLLGAAHENALLISYPEPGAAPYGDEEMKVRVRKGRVIDIAKNLPDEDADGENVGIVKFGLAGGRRLTGVLNEIVESGRLRDWAPRAFQVFAQEDALYAIGTRGLPWTEIDTREDYDDALDRVYPRIRGCLADAGRFAVGA